MVKDADNKERTLSEEEIDKVVTAQADDDSAWENPVKVTLTSCQTSDPHGQFSSR